MRFHSLRINRLLFGAALLAMSACGQSEGKVPVNEVYRDLNQSRVKVGSVGCELVTQDLGPELTIVCDEGDFSDREQQAAQLRSWAGVLESAAVHPDVSPEYRAHYQRLALVAGQRSLEISIALKDEVEAHENHRLKVESVYRDFVTSLDSFQVRLLELGCDFLADESGGPQCSENHIPEKQSLEAEILIFQEDNFDGLDELFRGEDEEESINSLKGDLRRLIQRVSSHIDNLRDENRTRIIIMYHRLGIDFGLKYLGTRALTVEEVSLTPQESNRTRDGYEEFKGRLEDFSNLVEYYLTHFSQPRRNDDTSDHHRHDSVLRYQMVIQFLMDMDLSYEDFMNLPVAKPVSYDPAQCQVQYGDQSC